MRQDEIVQLEWSCIDTKRRIATIHKTKGSKLRAVRLSARALAILKRQPQTAHSGIVFWRGKGLTIDWVSSQFGAVARKLTQTSKGVVRFRFHDLRHLFAVQYLRKGGSIYTLQGILGQAVTLDAMFAELARRCAMNMGDYINASERYGRLALKAQSNCRAMLEAPAKLHQPR